MEYKKFPDNFMELVDALSNYDKSKVVILPIPYEKTTTYMEGTKKGPKAILKASVVLQLYDEELEKNVCDVGICTLNNLKPEDKPKVMMDSIYMKVKKIISDNKFPIILGGEHSITPACVKAFSQKYNDISILQIDAHTDLVDEWDNTKYSHACAARRCFEITKNIVQVGIRSIDIEELEFAKKNKIEIFWAKDLHDNDEWFDKVISKLSKNVYITIDLDGLDPSFMPSVGNPEPGGLQYYQTLRFLKKLSEKRNIVGFDMVELCPNEKERFKL